MGQQEMHQREQQRMQQGVDEHGEGDSQEVDLSMDSDQGNSQERQPSGEGSLDPGTPPSEPGCADDAIVISDDEETPAEVRYARFKRRRRQTRGKAAERSANGTPSLLHVLTTILSGMCM